LIATSASGDESVLDLIPALRAALNGSGPALLMHAPADPPASIEAPASIELTDAEDDAQDPTAVAVTTSGSSGAAKTVLLPASALLASAGATHDRLGGGGHWLLALPAQHIAGVQVLVRSLIAGTRPAVLDLTSGFTPEGFIEAASRVGGARRYTALVPTQVSRLLSATGATGERAVEALRRFDAILIGGAATAPALREQAEAAGLRLISTYGMSETCGGCVYDGLPLDGVSVQIDEPDDDVSSAGGRVRLGGPMVARGYLNAGATLTSDPPSRIDPPSSIHSTFSTDSAGQRWFRTDDAGAFDAGSGLLQIFGRLDSVIITGGVNVSPAPVEAVVQRLPGVAEAVVVGLPDPEWGQRVAVALVLVPGATAPRLAAVRALVSAEVSGPAAPRQLTVLNALPLRGPGKPDRTAIEKALREQPPLEGL
jgi:O-succinylbenzoic acid--CoA ligase